MIQISVKQTNAQNYGPYTDFAEVGGGRADTALLQTDLVNRKPETFLFK